MEIPDKPSTRKRFLQWSAALLGSVSLFGLFSTPKAKKTDTVKMLTPDGRLVEVDKNILAAKTTGKKASNQEIYDWMKNPSK